MIAPPPLRDDCFALPAGVDWTPADVALDRLKNGLSVVCATEEIDIGDARGRVLSADVHARRSNPPAPNSAVDGYGFSFECLGETDVHRLDLIDGRAAAGGPFQDEVPFGKAIRILTGAILPVGVDTVILEEDVSIAEGQIAFHAGLKPFANTRKAGEDVSVNEVALTAGHRLGPQDVGLLVALGVSKITVFKRLRVGVLSTGDELVNAGPAEPWQTYDANRPMLGGLVEEFGYALVDLGQAPDDRSALKEILNQAASHVDAILISGGASGGDEDHVSALLREEGNMQTWRIAIKPGRPLALSLWHGVPVFGLPGNPVAAFVCSLIFARPALGVLAGQAWNEPQGFMVPASFTKTKKPGRREYLRARLNTDEQVEIFKSEGSGRISGLSWSTGLVELDEHAQTIEPKMPVRFIPYSSFGI